MILFIPTLAWSMCPRYSYPKDPNLDDEIENICHDMSYPNIVYGKASTMTVTQLNVSTITITGTVNITSLNLTTGTVKSFMVVGTGTNDDAPFGRIGESSSSVNSTGGNAAATGQYKDLGTLTLTAGDWDVTSIVDYLANGATWTSASSGISTTAGNSSAGLVAGDNFVSYAQGSSSAQATRVPLVVSGYRVSINTSTTFYQKFSVAFSVGTAQFNGSRLSARRVR